MTPSTITPTKRKRRTITARLARDIIIRQMAEGYVTRDGNCFHIACALCGRAIHTLEKTQWEHMVPFTLDGADDETNIRLCHDACSKAKTNGKPHVKVDGDKSKIAHANRLRAAHEAHKRGEARAAKMRTKGAKIPQRHNPWNKDYRAKLKEEGRL